MFQFSFFLSIFCVSLTQGGLYLRPYPDSEWEPKSFHTSNCEQKTKVNSENTVLDLSKTGIVRLKRNFINSSAITHICLNENNIWSVESGAFDGLPNLVYVDLAGNLIKFSNLSFGENVETLILDRAIRNEDHGYYVYVSEHESCQASTFRDRSLSCANVIELTSALGWKNLKELHLRENNIESIVLINVESMREIMPEIIRLHLNDNRITSVDFLELLPRSLTHLYLQNNKISEFKNDFLENLQVLTADGNNIKNLCGSYGNCKGMSVKSAVSLEVFSISNNGLEEIAVDSFEGLENLKHLNMSHNKIIKIVKHTFDDLVALKNLYLGYNKLISVPDICGLKNLETLSLQFNKIKAIGKLSFCGLSNITKLNLSSNLISEVDAEAFSSLVALEELDLSRNKLEVFPDDWISSKLSLKYLYLNDNFLKSVASLSLTRKTAIKFLYISGNPFKEINLRDFPGNTIVDMELMSVGKSSMPQTRSSSCLLISISISFMHCYTISILYYFL